MRTALVTGASRGIGRAIAARLEADGLKVLQPARAEMDLADPASVTRWLDAHREPIDVLVNNAGVNELASAAEVTHESIARTLAINLEAPLRLAGALGARMKERRWGRIVNIASVWALVSRERRVAYSAAKAGVVGLTRSLALELGPFGVLVNAVAPGYVDTELTRKNNSPAEIAAFEAQIPLGRMGTPAEIAKLVAWLASDENAYVTGQTIVADGGYTCR